MRYLARDHVHFVGKGHGNDHVRFAGARTLKHIRMGCVTNDRAHIQIVSHLLNQNR